MWIKCFVESLNLDTSTESINVFSNNQSIISLIKSGTQSSKRKHIDVHYHYILDIVERGEVKVNFVSSTEMVADLMTKGLSLEKFREHVTRMGLRET